MSGFRELLISAKADDAEAINKTIEMYQFLAAKKSYTNGVFDSELYQILLMTIWSCIRVFKIDLPR